MSGNGSPRITYKDIIAFREKIFDELTTMRKENADDRESIRGEITEVRVELGRQDEKFKGLIRRDTIGYILDSVVASIAVYLGVRHQ